MKARLFCVTGKFADVKFDFKERVTVGRRSTTETGYLTLRDERMSSRHAEIVFEAAHGGYVVQDLESTNGTTVGGHFINGRVLLYQLDVLNFGGTGEFVFQILDRKTAGVPETQDEETIREQEAIPMPKLRGGEEDPKEKSAGESLDDGRTILEPDPPVLPEALRKRKKEDKD